MKKELLEKLKSAKSKDELSDLIKALRKPDADGVQELSGEELDGVAGGAVWNRADLYDVILAVYDFFGPDMALLMLKSEVGVPQEYIDAKSKLYDNNHIREMIESILHEYLGV